MTREPTARTAYPRTLAGTQGARAAGARIRLWRRYEDRRYSIKIGGEKVAVLETSFDPSSHFGYVESLVVDEHWRGRGLGAQLLDRLCADADADAVTLWLTATAGKKGLSQRALLAFYRRRGFVTSKSKFTCELVRFPKEGS